jgi:hypothetical protein
MGTDVKRLGRSYLTLTKDVTRVMNRIKAEYRSWATPCSGNERVRSAKLLQRSETTNGCIWRKEISPPVEAELFS